MARAIRVAARLEDEAASARGRSGLVAHRRHRVRSLDVWRLRDRLPGGDRGRALRRLAVEAPKGWTDEGVTDLEQEAEIVASDDPRTAVRTRVRFNVADQPRLSVTRWRADEDGTVLRVCASAAPYIPASILRDEADAVRASLRRIDAEERRSGSVGSKKPWWKIG